MNIPCNFPGARLIGASPLLLSAALLIAACAAPQSSVEGTEESTRAHHFPGQDQSELTSLLAFLDRNGDGKIESYEGAEALVHLTSQADTNGDASLDELELRSFLGQQQQDLRDEIESTFRDLDSNADGSLTKAELPDSLQALVMQSDANSDLRVTLDELLASNVLLDPTAEFEQELLDFLASVDHDGDGAFAMEDLPPSERPDFQRDFKELDTDHDGILTKVELLSLIEQELQGATFQLSGIAATMTGVIGPTTPGRVMELVLEHPEIRTIIMLDVPGSMDDHSLVRAAAMVHRMGLATHIPANGEVASGGTDFFLAGVSRTVEPGARLGVHSWSGFNEEGADLPRSHPEHELYLDFYRSIRIPEDFYWFTLEAAPANGIHWVTADELEAYSMLTGDGSFAELGASGLDSGNGDTHHIF